MQIKMKVNKKHDYSTHLKMCSKCLSKKPRTLEFFYASSREKDGFHYICKECKKQIDKQSRLDNYDKFKEYQKSESFVFSQLKYQAKKRGMPFLIEYDYYLENLANKSCFSCGSKETKHWIDRVDNSKKIGYTVENSVPCCELCNKMKMALDVKTFLNHCRKISEFGKN